MNVIATARSAVSKMNMTKDMKSRFHAIMDNRIQILASRTISSNRLVTVPVSRAMSQEDVGRIRNEVPMFLNRITSVSVECPVIKRGLNWGSPKFDSADFATRIIEVRNISRNDRFNCIGQSLFHPDIMVPRNADLVSMSLRGKPFKECLALHHVSSAAKITSVYEDIPIGNTILYEEVPTVRVRDCDDSGHLV